MNLINLSVFNKANDGDLETASGEIVKKTKGNAAYVAEQDQVLKVETATGNFGTAISNARDGSISAKSVLVKSRKELLQQISLLAKMMELHYNEDEAFFLNAGFVLRKKPATERTPFAIPSIFRLRRDVLSGTVFGRVETLPKGFTQLAVQVSYDGGLTWKNGAYSSGLIFKLNGLPPRTTVHIRVKFLGTHERESDWSDPKEVFVL